MYPPYANYNPNYNLGYPPQQPYGIPPIQPQVQNNYNIPAQFTPPGLIGNQPTLNANYSGLQFQQQYANPNQELQFQDQYDSTQQLLNEAKQKQLEQPTTQTPQNNQQMPPYAYYGMLPYNPSDHFARAGSAAGFLSSRNDIDFSNNPYIKDANKAKKLGTAAAGLSVFANISSGLLDNAKSFLGAMGQRKLQTYYDKKQREALREGALGQTYGDELAFGNSYLQNNLVSYIKDGGKYNPWAICTSSVGRGDKAKYERCVMGVKRKHGYHEDGGCQCNGKECFKCGGKKKMYEDGGSNLERFFKSYADGGQHNDMSKILTGSYTKGLSEEEYEQSENPNINAEVEVGEIIINPQTKEVREVLGDTHSNGGEKLSLPDGAMILTDAKNVVPSKEQLKKYKKEMGLDVSPKHTFADIYRMQEKKIGLAKLNDKQEKEFDKVKKNDETTDENTKNLNNEFLSKKVNDIEREKSGLQEQMFDFATNVLFKDQEEVRAALEESDYDGEFIYVKDGGKIKVIYQDGGYYTEPQYKDAFMNWATKEKKFKNNDELQVYLKNGGKKKKTYQQGGEEQFQPHIMIDPNTGQQVVAQTYEQHIALTNQGWLHENELKDGGKKKKMRYYELGGSDIDSYVDKLIQFEGSKGSAKGTGLSISEFTGGKAKTKEELKKLINEQYLAEVKTELGDQYDKLDNQILIELLDYKFNTGRNVGDLLSYAEGAITLDEINSNKSFGAPQVVNIGVGTLRRAKDDVYRTTKGGTLEKPSAAYTNSWSQRVDYLTDKENPEYRGMLTTPTGDYDATKDQFSFDKATALDYVPSGQSKQKTGTYGRVTPEEVERLKKENPWYTEEINPNNKESVLAFQQAFNEKAGRKILREDGFLGEQTSTARIPWLRPEAETVPTTEEVTTDSAITPYQPIGGGYGGYGWWGGANPPIMWAFDRGLPPFNTQQPIQLQHFAQSPEKYLTEIGRQQRLAQQGQTLGADYAANVANTQRIASDASSQAIAQVQEANMARAVDTDNRQAMLNADINRFNIGEIKGYEQEAVARRAAKHFEDMSLRQRNYEMQQKALREQRELNTLSSIYNYGFNPMGGIYHDPSRDVPVTAQGFPYNLQQQRDSKGNPYYLTPEEIMLWRQQVV